MSTLTSMVVLSGTSNRHSELGARSWRMGSSEEEVVGMEAACTWLESGVEVRLKIFLRCRLGVRVLVKTLWMSAATISQTEPWCFVLERTSLLELFALLLSPASSRRTW